MSELGTLMGVAEGAEYGSPLCSLGHADGCGHGHSPVQPTPLLGPLLSGCMHVLGAKEGQVSGAQNHLSSCTWVSDVGRSSNEEGERRQTGVLGDLMVVGEAWRRLLGHVGVLESAWGEEPADLGA